MNANRQNQLRTELRAAGAAGAELRALLPLASKLEQLDAAPVSRAREVRWLKPASLALSGLAVGAFLIILSQAALPTSWLYPVQKLSDHLAVTLHPNYRATIMMKRAEQVNELVAQRANSDKILATLADYTKEAGAYKDLPHTSYAAFEYCKSNLEQASAKASPAVRQAIARSLESLAAA